MVGQRVEERVSLRGAGIEGEGNERLNHLSDVSSVKETLVTV